MAYHHVEWSDCSHHPHLGDARTLLERFWEDHREGSAGPPPAEAPRTDSTGNTLRTPVQGGLRRGPEVDRKLGPIILGLVVGSWLPIGLLVDLLDTPPVLKIGMIMGAVYVTLALGYYAMKRLGVP